MGFLGDLLFPDNPKRRERAQELYSEIKSYEQVFKENYSQYKTKLAEARQGLDEALKQHGYANSQELEDKVTQTIESSVELQKYNEIKASIDKLDHAESVVFDLISLAAIATGFVVVPLAALSIISWPVASGIMGLVTGIGLEVTGAILILDVFVAARERTELRHLIQETLVPKRKQVALYTERMKVLDQWAGQMLAWVSAGVQNTAQFAKYLQKNLAPDYDACAKTAEDSLRFQDRNSWTREDYPQGSYYVGVQEDATSTSSSGYTVVLSFTLEDGNTSLTKTFWDIQFFSKRFCTAVAENGQWSIEAADPDQFHFARFLHEPDKPFAYQETHRNCTVKVHSVREA